MERSRSRRSYHYDQDSDSQTPPPPPRGKARFDTAAPNHRRNHHRRGGGGDRRPLPPPPKPHAASSPPAASLVTTYFRILCPESHFPAVTGKSGINIKSLRHDTGAWINVHQLVPGDDERIIETSDNRRREPDGRSPQYSPAQEALLLIHQRIVEAEFELGNDEDEDEYGSGGGWGGGGMERDRGRGRMTTRLVVPRGNVGCLLGKGGKIIEQMRMETKTHIRILPRDQYTPRCVSASEEIVQVVGEGSCVKKAVAVISTRLKDSLHRDHGPFRGRLHSPERYPPPGDEFMNNAQQRPALEGPDFISRSSALYPYDDIVFRILCPSNKVKSVTGLAEGIIELLREDVGVDVRVTDPVPSLEEHIIIISSDEGPDDELFPAQEALLHIQTRIVDLGPDKDNIITTRLLVPSIEAGCLEGRNGSSLSEIQRLTGANIQFVQKELLPPGVFEADELVQIVGEIKAARNALVQLTEKLRSYLYRDISIPKDMIAPSVPAPVHVGSVTAVESSSPLTSLPRDVYQGGNFNVGAYQTMHTAPIAWQLKDTGGCASGQFEQEESNTNDEGRQSAPKRFNAPLVTKSTLEVIIPKYAVQSLIMRSGSKLAQISEMSGATVCLIEDRPDQTEKIVQISGSPEQTERAQSLLQGFILSTQDDVPSS